MHTITRSTGLSPAQKQQLQRLWNTEYPSKLVLETTDDIDEYLGTLQQPTHYLMLNDEGIMLGWAVVFVRNNEPWFAIIIDSVYQRLGLGKSLLNRLRQDYHALNGWVIDHDNDLKRNGQVYSSPLGFYLQNGFTVDAGTRLELDKISAVKIYWCEKPR